MSQLIPLPLTVPCFSKIQIGFTFLVLAHLGSPRKRAVKRVCVCVCCQCDWISPVLLSVWLNITCIAVSVTEYHLYCCQCDWISPVLLLVWLNITCIAGRYAGRRCIETRPGWFAFCMWTPLHSVSGLSSAALAHLLISLCHDFYACCPSIAVVLWYLLSCKN